MALTRPRYSQIYDTDYKQSVRVATTADVGNLLATGNMTNTVDGVSLNLLDRILVKDQNNAEQNGIYRVLTVGTGSDGTWERALDANANDKITAGMTTIVSEGDTNTAKTFRLATPDPIVVGTTELTFVDPFVITASAGGANTQVQFNDVNQLGGSPGLTFDKAGNVLSVGGNINVTGSILPSANVTYDLGSPTLRWRDGYFSGNTIDLGGATISVDPSNGFTFTAPGTSTVSLSGNGSLSSNIITANTNMKGYVDEQISTTTSAITTANTNLKGYTDNLVSTANVNLKGYVDAANTIQSNQISGANAAIVTANTNIKGYVDGEISTTNLAITTANTNMKGYVDNGLSSLSSNKISANASNVTVTANFINVAVNSSNIASFSSTGIITTGNIDAASVNATNLYGAIQTAAQPNITSLGTLSGLTMGGALAMGTNKITGLDTPIASTDAATKQYVDEVAAGLKAAPAVEAATTTNLTANYNNGNLGVGATLTATSNGAFPNIDGVAITSTTTGENGVLVKNQSTSAQNGRYNLTQVGDGSNPWILTRCGVCDEADEIPGSYVFVKAGSTLASTGWVAYVAEPSTFVVGTNNITYFQFSGAGTYTAGTGLTLAGTQFSVDAVQTQITQVGTLGNLTVSGNVSASFIIGNGSQLTGLPAGYTNTDVANYLPNHSGNVGASSVNATNLFGTIRTAAQTNITSVGTLTSGTWNANIINSTYGGMGVNNGGRTLTVNTNSGTISFTGAATTLTVAAAASVSGTNTGDQTTVSGNAGSATVLQTARNIGGVSFNGSADINLPGVNTTGNQNTTGSAATLTTPRAINGVNFNGSAAITVPAAAGTLTGATLASGVTASSLTSVGTLTGLTMSGLITGKNNTGVTVAASNDTGSMSVRGDASQAAVISFHRTGVYAVNMGLDTDNVFKIGGWSDGAGYRFQVTSGGLITGTATSARYADLAEKYTADSDYSPGTVVVFGGDKEITLSTTSHDPSVAGVVSTNPAHLMNAELENGLPIALQGRVPCRVLGPVNKGDRVVSSDIRGVAERLDMAKYQPGCIIGKALDYVPADEIATIEVVVGRN